MRLREYPEHTAYSLAAEAILFNGLGWEFWIEDRDLSDAELDEVTRHCKTWENRLRKLVSKTIPGVSQ